MALYAQAPGQTGYSKVATNSSGSGSGSFSYTATAGDGSYGFYTIATDNAGNVQATPAGAQTTTVLNTAAPSSTASSPALTNQTSFNVSYTATAGSAGLAQVALYAQAPGQTGYTKVATNSSGSGSGSFSYTATAGDGSYGFYTVATDNAGNAQATPSTPQTTTLLDTTPPSSTASSPTATNQTTFTVSYTAADNTGGSGLAQVALYAKAPGQTGYTKVATNTGGATSGSFSYAAGAGHGTYSFYTIATDQAGNTQTTPAGAQTTTLLDTTPPTSTASSPSTSSTTNFTVSYTAADNSGGSGLAQVALYAKTPGQTAYTKVATNTSGSGTGSFSYTATAGNGTYSFYTIATDQSGNVQATPSSAQTTTNVENATTTTIAAPTSDATSTAIAPSSIAAKLSSATSGATGTITFTVFGPQASAPTKCTSGGHAVGTATVGGSGTYNPSSGYTPTGAGTYWWYASYGGDGANVASNSGCGSAMASMVVKNAPVATAAAPGTGTVGTAIAASSISSKLSGATSAATGTLTFEVFGPQASPPTTCTTGGTQVGSPVAVSGNATYHPSAGITPAATGDYWWYASYSGDSNNSPASSACGTAMGESVAYSETSAASAVDTSADSSTTTSSFTIQPNTTYVLLVSRHSQAGDSISSISSTGLTPALSTASFALIGSQTYNSVDYQWAYDVTTSGTNNGNGTLTVGFAKTLAAGGSTILELLQLGGNNTTNPVVTTNKVTSHGSGTSATANLPSAPNSLDAEVVFLSAQQDLGTAPTASAPMTSAFYSHQAAGSADAFVAVPGAKTHSLALSASVNWGSMAFEIQHG